mmetsp:Transcript_2782/g.7652  ORF Transcript_2782/g.7652 Transcript_2782/m.7652 type:complete len:251 (+) Transcript_2782:332-1084(+)
MPVWVERRRSAASFGDGCVMLRSSPRCTTASHTLESSPSAATSTPRAASASSIDLTIDSLAKLNTRVTHSVVKHTMMFKWTSPTPQCRRTAYTERVRLRSVVRGISPRIMQSAMRAGAEAAIQLTESASSTHEHSQANRAKPQHTRNRRPLRLHGTWNAIIGMICRRATPSQRANSFDAASSAGPPNPDKLRTIKCQRRFKRKSLMNRMVVRMNMAGRTRLRPARRWASSISFIVFHAGSDVSPLDHAAL